MATSPCSSTEQDESVETSDNVIAEFQAWSVFFETGPDQCFVGADPLETIIEPALAEESLCRCQSQINKGANTRVSVVRVFGTISFLNDENIQLI